MEGRTVGVLASYFAGVYYGPVTAGVAEEIWRTGGRLVAVQTSNYEARGEREDLSPPHERVAWERLSGVITIGNAAPIEYFEELRAAGRPVISVSKRLPGVSCPLVAPDNSVKEAVEHLIGHGHTRIAFAGCLDNFDIQQRYESYRSTLADNGIEPKPDLVFRASNNIELGGRQLGAAILAAGVPSTAVIVGTDLGAIGVMSVLKQAGLDVPGDVAIVGFDNQMAATIASPGLTTISQDFRDLGMLAAQLLIGQMSGSSVSPGPHLTRTKFVVRESCGCPPNTPSAYEDGNLLYTDPVRRFVKAISHAIVPGDGSAGRGSAASAAGEVASVFATALNEEVDARSLTRVSEASGQLYRISTAPHALSAILGLAHRLSAEVAIGSSSETAARDLSQCVAAVGHGLWTAALRKEADAYFQLRKSMQEEYAIILELLGSHQSDPRSLSWLALTPAVAGALALWPAQREVPWPSPSSVAPGDELGTTPRPPSSDRAGRRDELEVAGTYEKGPRHLALADAQYPSELFPPSELIERSGPGDILFVYPVKSGDIDWGFLAVVAPLDAAFVGQDTYFEWSAMLSRALDRYTAQCSLAERNAELASAYHREREMALAVKVSAERYALAAQAANDGLWDWDLTAGTVYYSSRWAEMLGYPHGSVVASPQVWLNLVHPEDLAGLEADIEDLRMGRSASILHEHRVRAADGKWRWALCRALAVPGQGQPANRIVGSLTDVTERHELEQRLRHQALYDALTGLPNRVLFLERLSHVIAANQRHPERSFAVLWLDLDGFKVLNDSLGHMAGDELLVNVAERVNVHLRRSDTAARFGGDEFAVLLEDLDLTTVEDVAGRLLTALCAPHVIDGNEVVVTASVGVATSTGRYEGAEDVLRDADIAMYRAKRAGRGGFAVFDGSMHTKAVARLAVETELRRALDHGELELYYQPIVQLATGRVISLEALMRWNRPRHGTVGPMEFFGVAEESGLMVPIGRWVVREAISQVVDWGLSPDLPPDLKVSINLSNQEFWDGCLITHLDETLASTSALPENLIFEVTEGVIMNDLQGALSRIQQLRERGARVHLDDFGTGRTSLESLNWLPIDALKIDKAFVAPLSDDPGGRAAELLRIILLLGKNLGVDVICEGIETTSQERFLRELGCPLGQGYFFSRPVPASRVPALFSSRKANGKKERKGQLSSVP